ncbi:MAG: MarC family protein [Deltaproteobacteria bacterium]|nr:MarC family protein [Deltaproteobacteria bacterium]
MSIIIENIFHDYLLLFAMVNAVGNLPIFADLTCDMDRKTRNDAFRIAVVTAASIVISFAFIGDWMLRQVFVVDTASFKIAGGVLVFAVAARGMILGPRQLSGTNQAYDNIAVFPMGFPYLAGPGTIVTTILLFQSGGSLVTATAALIVYLTILPILRLVPYAERALGRMGMLVLSRILYIFICAKAVTFMMDGLRSWLAVPTL